MDKIAEAAQKLKEKISNNPLEKLLNEATSDVNWNASNKILQEIADHTYSFGDFTEVMKFIWKRLGSERKQWRKILKTLTLIEYLIKNGSPKCVQEFQREIYLIRTLQDFSHYEDGQDRGAAIREVSKRTVQLLGDDAKIDEERKKAQDIRERLGNLGATGSSGSAKGGFGSSSSSSYGGFSSKDPRASERSWTASTGSTGDGTRKTKDWRVQKTEETSNKVEEKEKEKEEAYVEKTGTKYNTSNQREKEEEQERKAAEKKKLAPPKGMKVAPTVQQPEVDLLFEMDATSQPQAQPTQASAPANTGNAANNNVDFGWDAPQAQPKSDTIWNWEQGQPQNATQPAQTTQPTQPSAPNMGGFNWNQAPTNQPAQPTIQNLYQQQPQQPMGGFGFNNAPQNNMNNLTSQLNQISFNTTPNTGGNFNMGGFNNTQPTQPVNNNMPSFNSSPPKADGFDDFMTAKSTGPTVNEYKNYSQQEKSIIDLSDIANEASKKKNQKEKVEVSKNSNEGFLYSSKEDLDNFFVPSQPLNNLTNMNMNMYQGTGAGGMGGGFNPGMMSQGMKPMGGMQPMGGMNPMGGMQPMGGMMGNNMMGMQGMQMGMNMGNMGGGFQNMGMNPNAGFNQMNMQNMQGGFNPNMNQMNQMSGFGYR